eukprot:jgi/Chlat1/7327/Chrsp58S06939
MPERMRAHKCDIQWLCGYCDDTRPRHTKSLSMTLITSYKTRACTSPPSPQRCVSSPGGQS